MADPVYPYVLPVPAAPRWIMIVLSLGLAGAFIAMVIFGSASPRNDPFWILFVVIVGGATLYAWHVWASRVTLWQDHIELRSGFRTLRLRRDEIAGYRSTSVRGGRSVQLVLSDGRAAGVPEQILRDETFKRWIGRWSDFNTRDLAASRRALRDDPALGATAEDRDTALARFRWIALVANGAGVVVWLAQVWYAAPGWFIDVALPLPALAVALNVWSGGVLALTARQTDARPSIFWLAFGSVFGIVLRSLDLHLIDTRALFVDAAFACALFALAVVMADRRFPRRPVSLGFLLSLSYAYAACLLAQLDVRLDHAAPKVQSVAVLGKYSEKGRSTTYHLELAGWGPLPQPYDILVPAALYDRVESGGKVCVATAPGWLKIRWYRLDPC